MTEKVLIVGQFPPPITGEGKMNLQVAAILNKAGFKVKVLNSCIVDSVNDVGVFNVSKFMRLLKLYLKAISLQVGIKILYMTPGQTFLGLLRFLPLLWFARFANRKVILHWHGYGVLSSFKKYPRLARYYLSPRYLNIVLTDDLRAKFQLLGFEADTVKVLRNFSELTSNPPVQQTENAKLKIVFLGGLMSEKGVDIFLDLASQSRQFELVLCGAGDAAITERAKLMAEQGLLTFLGVVDGIQKQELLKEADVFVLQTHYETEGVPLTILEAMSCSCAIVTTKHNGIPETVSDAAFFIEPKSLDSLLSGLEILDNDRNLLKILQLKAFERSHNFSAESFREELLRFFRF